MNPPLDAVKAVIKQFVVHHDGCSSADMCFSVLQNERGLSVHFLLDNDGTIYQTIDLGLMAYHASEWNTASIGIELCNRGDAKPDREYYSSGRFGPKRDVKPCKINGHTILAFDYTPAQYDSFIKLCRALTRLLPNLPTEFPQSSPGVQSWDTLPTSASFNFAGYLGHYHLTGQKWDPGVFDFKDFCSKLRGEFCFPVFAKDDAKRSPNDKPVIPERSDDLKQAASDLYKINEGRADGGYFPVGPWGEARLWHGGVHLVAADATPVYAPLPGRIVAARMGRSTSVGSVNFVLLRHDLSLGDTKTTFFSLFMHLANDGDGNAQPEWMSKKDGGWKKDGRPDAVVLLDEPVAAGALIGHVGKAGPAELSRAQIHVEFFSTSELFPNRSPWQLVDGTAGGRFCDSKEINDNIDTDHDGALSRQELSTFYSNGNGADMHFMVTLHVSEWTSEPSWSEALRVPKDFKKLKPAEIDQLVADQIAPGLWWDAKVAAHCRLPVDGVVYHYHPISFLAWFKQQMLDAAANDKGTGKANEGDAKEAKSMGLLDDYADVNGSSMRSAADLAEDPCNQKLTLNDLVQGFDTPECGP